MQDFNPSDYGALFEEVLNIDRNRELGPGTPVQERRASLDRLTLDDAFAHATVVDRNMARCCMAGVWLLHDFLDESHTISQSIKTASGSYWHGIMHRREPDYSNAKYWFRNVGTHDVFAPLDDFAAHLSDEFHAGAWDPFRFVDLCEQARGDAELTSLCRRVQQCECELLFDYCYRRAVR